MVAGIDGQGQRPAILRDRLAIDGHDGELLRRREREPQEREALLQLVDLLAREGDPLLLIFLHRPRRRGIELGPRGGGLAFAVMAIRQVEQPTELRVQPLALGELRARLADLAGIDQRLRFAELTIGALDIRLLLRRAAECDEKRGSGRAQSRRERPLRRNCGHRAILGALATPGKGLAL